MLPSEYAAKLFLQNKMGLQQIKNIVSKRFHLKGVLKNSRILACIPREKRTADVLRKLRIRNVRTLSGVSVIAVMSKPSSCPHGRCIYCPRGEDAAQSYTGKEPAAMRGIQNKYDPYRQVTARVRQLHEIGHQTSKCELIVMGGTFPAQKKRYKRWFMRRCFDAFNGSTSRSLEDAMKKNERASRRVVGITFETRPDYAMEKHVDEMLEMGGTRVELGVQTLSDAVYKKAERGHTIADVIRATKVCRDAGLKVCYHMMPFLFSDKKADIEMFKKLFDDERFRPDMLKIYPTLVLKGTGLYNMWKKGTYRAYSTDDAVDLLSDAMRHIPKYVRIMRAQRDIPSPLIVAGVKKSNLRQLVEQRAKEKKIKLKEIRSREVGLRRKKTSKKHVRLLRHNYGAGNGKEFFLSFEDTKNDALIGFLRLRIPGQSHRKEIDSKTAIVRELHVYGREVSVGAKAEGEAQQHQSYGKRLLKEAEKMAKKHGKKKIAVTSGVGAREYYRKLGYRKDGVYMGKRLT